MKHFGAALPILFCHVFKTFHHLFSCFKSSCVREEDEIKFNDLSMFNESDAFDHVKKSLCAMVSGWGLRGNEEHANLTMDMLGIGCHAPNDPLHSVAKNYVGFKDFTDKSLQLTMHDSHTRSEGELLPMPVFDANGKFFFF